MRKIVLITICVWSLVIFIQICMCICRQQQPKININPTVDVICLVQNNSAYIQYLRKLVPRIQDKYPSDTLKVHFFENDSTDDTVAQLDQFVREYRYVTRYELKVGRLNDFSKDWSKTDALKRLEYMVKIRQWCKEKLGTLESDYTVLIDSEVIFTEDTIHQMIMTLRSNTQIGMVTPYTMIYGQFGHYYDTLALQLKGGQRSWPHCPFNACTSRWCKNLCEKHKCKKISVGRKCLTVDLAFGGMCLMYTKWYNRCRYKLAPSDRTEHDSFTKQYKSISRKRVVIDPSIKLWM